MSVEGRTRVVTTRTLQQMKERGERIAMLTSYDYSMAQIVDAAGIDVVLVGDSASNVMAGYESTLPITLDQMIYHATSVVRATKGALVVVDLPFGSYQGDSYQALKSSIRIMQESGADAVKIEGGVEIVESLRRILSAGIPYTVRAKEFEEAEKLRRDALLLQEEGCFSIVLEKIPADLAREVTDSLRIPTIGIGAGGGTDGQVLVAHDMLGITQAFSPRFLRRYASLGDEIFSAVKQYISDVKSKDFPNEKESY